MHLPMLRTAPAPVGSFVVYRGPSVLDGKTIMAILTGTRRTSHNTKTGGMAQLWILPAEVDPYEAQRTGADASVCGSCPLRPSSGGEVRCYVRTFQGPLSTWKANRTAPVRLGDALAALHESGRGLRLGAYGDPAAVPEDVVTALAGASAGGTAYTHAWRHEEHAWLKTYAMASVESGWDGVAARSKGWRTFRVLREDEPPMPGEILCPFETRGVQCEACGLCSGASTAKSIAIHAH